MTAAKRMCEPAGAQTIAAAPAVTAADTCHAAHPTGPATRRLIGLDVARGLMLVVSVAVNAWLTMPGWFTHAPWAGVHPLDLVFPVFVTLSGCGLAFAYGRHVAVGATLRRVAILLLAGFAYNAFNQFAVTGRVEWATFRTVGVLQLYAALVLAVALLHLVLRRWWHWPLLTIGLAAAYSLGLTAFAGGCPGGALTPECNPSGVLDPAIFGADHLYLQGSLGHDPEGIVAFAGALIAACGGASIGHILRTPALHGAGRLVVGSLVAASFGVTAIAIVSASGSVVEPMKRLWTPPFGLAVAAACGLALLVLHAMLDSGRGPRQRRRALDTVLYPLIALGRNSLLVYFGSHAVMVALLCWPRGPDIPGAGAYAYRIAATAPFGLDAALWLVVLAVGAWTALASVLHWRGIYLRP